jgi:hypothetical protein
MTRRLYEALIRGLACAGAVWAMTPVSQVASVYGDNTGGTR